MKLAISDWCDGQRSGSFNEDKRSIDLEKLGYLPFDAGFVLLQKELIGSEEKFIASGDNWVAPCSDFSGTAAICELLDVVVSGYLHCSPCRWDGKANTVVITVSPRLALGL